MHLGDLDYPLPEGRIAQHPLPSRSQARLLLIQGHKLTDTQVHELPSWLCRGDLLVVNDTQVVKARLYARKPTGAKVEIFFERALSPALALVHLKGKNLLGAKLCLDETTTAEVVGQEERLWRLLFSEPVMELLARLGEVPLPPYIRRPLAVEDEARYQSLFARRPGAVAAPTASLHFDESLLKSLASCGIELARVTLHVGAGTFLPMRTSRPEEHLMHEEWFCVPQETAEAIQRAKSEGRRVVAVGTTVLRALESAALGGKLLPQEGFTRLFITPGFTFRVADALLTNFHAPHSTLLLLVSAFLGSERLRAAYAQALDSGYRFLSYGDAMLAFRA